MFGGGCIKFVTKCFQEYRPVVAVYPGSEPMSLTIDEDLLQDGGNHRLPLVRGQKDSYSRLQLSRKSERVEYHLDDEWTAMAEMRGIQTPTFSSSKLKQMTPQFADAIATVTSKME